MGGSRRPPPPPLRGSLRQTWRTSTASCGISGAGEGGRPGGRGALLAAGGAEEPAAEAGAWLSRAGLRWTWTQSPARPAGQACLPSVTRTQRLASGVCLLLAALCFGLAALCAPVLLLRARKFALLWSLGSALALAGGTLLRGGAAWPGTPAARRGGALAARAALRGRARRERCTPRCAAEYVAHSAGRLLKSPHCWPRCWACFPAARAPLCASRSGGGPGAALAKALPV